MSEEFTANLPESTTEMLSALFVSALREDIDDISRDILRDDIRIAVGRLVMDRFTLNDIPAILRNDTVAYVVGDTLIRFQHTLAE